jgi:hypothetical protein
MARDKLLPLLWPKGGFVENSAISDQPATTTTDCLNVRNFDALDRRNRGGQRTGLALYLADAVNGSNSIQAMTQAILAFDSNTVVADTVLQADPDDATVTDDISYSDGTFETVSSAKWETYERDGVNLNFMYQTKVDDAESLTVTSNKVQAPIAGISDGFRGASLATKPALGTSYVLKYTVEFPAGTVNIGRIWLSIRGLDDLTNPGDSNRTSGYSIELERESGVGTVDMNARVWYHLPGTGTSEVVANDGFTTTSDAVFTADVEVIVNGDILNVKVNSISAITNYTMADHSEQSNVAFAIERLFGGTSTQCAVTSVTYSTGLLPASRRTTKLIVVSGGSVYSGNKDGVVITSNGSGIFQSDADMALQPAFQKVYISDGVTYRILDPKTNVVSDWQSSMTDGALPHGGNGTTYSITAVDTTAGTFTVAEDLSSLTSSSVIEVRNSTGNDGTYSVASDSGTGPTVITVNETIRDATVDGIIAVGNVTGRIMALYRGRIVITGLETDPHNIFFLEAGNPLVANYFPADTSDIQPVAANFNKSFGLVGDVVTAFATYTDDMAIIGMANSMAVLRGDPAAGGQIDNISDKIGIVGSEAWTFDTAGNFYFMGVNGLYRMDLSSFQPVLLSQNKLDTTFSDIDTAAKRIQLIFDPKWQGVHILVKSQIEQDAGSEDTHYFWDARTDSFWPDQYPAAHGPVSAYRFTSDDPEENAVLFGGWDSKVRAFSDTATDDDGTVISSYCRFTPVSPGSILASSRIHDITVIMDDQSDDSIFKIFTGHSAENAEANADAGTARMKRTLKGGRNAPMRQRVSQNTIIAEISQAGVDGAGATWAFEKAMARVAVMDRMHGRGV